MAENTDESTAKLTENEMSLDSAEISLVDDKAVSSDKENHEEMDISMPSTSKETSETTSEKEKIEDMDLCSPEKQQDTSKTDCNGDLREEAKADEPIISVEPEIIESEHELEKEDYGRFLQNEPQDLVDRTTIESNLNEILKIVHGDLAIEMLQTVETATAKDTDKGNNKEEQQTVKKKNDDASTDDTADSAKQGTASVSTKDKSNSVESLDKMEEKSNFGIVRSPTAIGELIEEQLANDSALSTDRTDHIVEWVKNSVKVNTNEESNVTEEDKLQKEAQKRKIISKTPPFVSSRKSQKIVSNIIKKSIKWKAIQFLWSQAKAGVTPQRRQQQ